MQKMRKRIESSFHHFVRLLFHFKKSFECYFGGGENAKYVEKWKAACSCGWKDEFATEEYGATKDPNLKQ
jgi:hypothetical protein